MGDLQSINTEFESDAEPKKNLAIKSCSLGLGLDLGTLTEEPTTRELDFNIDMKDDPADDDTND